MLYNNVLLTVRAPDDVARVADGLKALAAASLGEAGCLRFDIMQSETNPALFFLIEEWVDEGALAAHRDEPHFAEVYMKEIVPLVERDPHLCNKL